MPRAFEDGLILQQLRYADEIRPFSEIPVAPAEVKEPELRLAMQLIEQIATEKFQPDQYEDTVRQSTRDLIEKKVQGEEITAVPQEAPKAQIIDLMEALKASLSSMQPADTAKPVSIASRKGPKPSPRTAAVEEEETVAASPRKKSGGKR